MYSVAVLSRTRQCRRALQENRCAVTAMRPFVGQRREAVQKKVKELRGKPKWAKKTYKVVHKKALRLCWRRLDPDERALYVALAGRRRHKQRAQQEGEQEQEEEEDDEEQGGLEETPKKRPLAVCSERHAEAFMRERREAVQKKVKELRGKPKSAKKTCEVVHQKALWLCWQGLDPDERALYFTLAGRRRHKQRAQQEGEQGQEEEEDDEEQAGLEETQQDEEEEQEQAALFQVSVQQAQKGKGEKVDMRQLLAQAAQVAVAVLAVAVLEPAAQVAGEGRGPAVLGGIGLALVDPVGAAGGRPAHPLLRLAGASCGNAGTAELLRKTASNCENKKTPGTGKTIENKKTPGTGKTPPDLSMPVGPKSTSQYWFATNRLQYNVFGCVRWCKEWDALDSYGTVSAQRTPS
jgi:hypothetical protein